MPDAYQEIFGDAPRAGELTRQEENAWRMRKYAECQRFWHDRFDEDETLGGPAERPDPIPSHIDEDYRLLCGFAAAKTETRLACYSIFPHGVEMHRRFEEYLSAPRPEDNLEDGRQRAYLLGPAPQEMSEAHARELIAEIAKLLQGKISTDVDWAKIQRINYSSPDADEVLSEADDIPDLLERSPLDPSRFTHPPSHVASLFLTEPHYMSAGNCYQLGE